MSGYHLNRGMVGGLRFVRHRIDGLEKCPLETTEEAGVRHRIDGLESYDVVNGQVLAVRHRIDGLENG